MSTARPQRKLSRNHFAFMRALAQGLDTRTSWDRYMAIEGDGADRSTVLRVVRWVREEFAIAALQLEKPGTARLWRFDESKISEVQGSQKPQQPTLEEFVALKGWEDFSQDMQTHAYIEEYGLPKIRKNGRARLIARQLAAIAWLESRVAQDPAAGDFVRAWLSPALAKRLETAGIPTLFALAERINGLGEGWHRNIAGIGSGKASRIVDWMRENEASTRLAIGVHAMVKRAELRPEQLAVVVSPGTALRPLEKFTVPDQLSGREGRFRAPREHCGLSAADDYEAIQAWLLSKRAGKDGALSPTQRAYRKEAERLLLWSILERRKALSSLAVEDAAVYVQFLASPPAHWCGPRHLQRWSPFWRPLEGPLQASARAQAITILQSLFTWLNAQRYLVGNPFGAIARPQVPTKPIGSGRTLSENQIAFALADLRGLSDAPARRWFQLALPWLYFTGLRQAEMVGARCGDLVQVDGGNGAWLQNVVGKGGKARVVPVPGQLVDELVMRLKAGGFPANPADPQNAQIPILSVDGSLPVSASGLYKALKRFFESRADKLAASDPVSAAKLRQASAHWLRHSHASHLVNGGPGRAAVPVHVVRENLGHESLDTTTGYISTEVDQRVEAMQDFFVLAEQ